MKPPSPFGISPSMGRTSVLLGVKQFLMVNLFFLCEASVAFGPYGRRILFATA